MNKNSLSAFHQRLDDSRFSVFLMAEYLHKRGYSVNIPAFVYRKPGSNWQDHVDNGDLFIQKDGGPQYRIDVKHSTAQFTGPEDYPYSNMLVAEIRSIERANPCPLVYCIVNEPATHVALIWWKTKPHWFEKTFYASNTDKMQTNLCCPLEYVEFREIDVRV